MSKPKIRLHLEAEVRKAEPPFEGADHAVVEGACPLCGATPFKVQGTGRRIQSHDTYAADTVTMCCEKPGGELRVTVNTLFGIREDEEVLRGRCRVY